MDEYDAFVAMMGKPNVYVRIRINLTKEETKKRLRRVGEDLRFEFTKRTLLSTGYGSGRIV